MPKAKKRPASSLSKDFDKQKTKLGKPKKTAASSATNTSFKARSIALTQQSITKDRSGAATSKRNLTVDELISQTRHYSASVRSDALTGLKDIYDMHRSLAERHMSLVTPNVSRLISDEDAGVRASLRSFLTFYLSLVPAASVAAHASTLLLYTTSAMSHIYPDISIDAVRILDILYPSLGSIIPSGWTQSLVTLQDGAAASSSHSEQGIGHGERVLSCYMSLLGIPLNADDDSGLQKSSQVVSSELSTGARLIILQSMHSFFKASVGSSQVDIDSQGRLDCPTWFWDASFTSLPELSAFRSCLMASTLKAGAHSDIVLDETPRALSDIDSVLGKGWNSTQVAEALSRVTSLIDKGNDSRANTNNAERGDHRQEDQRQRLFQILSPFLISVFLDAAPSAYGPSATSSGPPSVSAQLVCSVVNLSLALWRASTSSHPEPRECLKKLLQHVSAYFPFGAQMEDAQREDIIQLNLAYCELVGLLAVTGREQSKKRRSEELKMQLDQVKDFVIGILEREGNQLQIRQPILRGKTYIDLLPTIWLLLDGDEAATSQEVVNALLLHWGSLRATDPTKRIAAEFIGRLWLLPFQRSYRGTFTVRPASVQREPMAQWLTQSVPRYLWELHGKDTAASSMLLQLLRIMACQADGLLIKDAELEKMGALLAPFFQSYHATKGAINGPYVRLPAEVQRTARGLLSALPSLDDRLQRAASAVGAWPKPAVGDPQGSL